MHAGQASAVIHSQRFAGSGERVCDTHGNQVVCSADVVNRKPDCCCYSAGVFAMG